MSNSETEYKVDGKPEKTVVSQKVAGKESNMKLFTNCWQNTGMPNQPIYVYQTEKPDDWLGRRIGNYVALSSDMQRVYHITEDGNKVTFNGFTYEVADPVHTEDGNTPEYACHYFVENCEEVFTDGYSPNIYFKDIAENMIAMSERFGLGWVMQERYNREEYSEYWEVYSADFAKKLHLNENVYCYCYSEEVAEDAMNELVADGKIAKCSMEFEDIITPDPDGGYEEDKAIVVYFAEKVTLECFEDDGEFEAELVDTFEDINHNCMVTMPDLSGQYEVLFTDKGTYARRKDA